MGLGQRGVLVSKEAGEGAAAQLDQVEPLAPGPLDPGAVVVERHVRDRTIGVEPLEDGASPACEDRLLRAQLDGLHVAVALEELLADEDEEALEALVPVLDSRALDEVLHR